MPVRQRRKVAIARLAALVGGQIGYRWQAASWVFGVEAQGDWADLKGYNTSLFVSVGPSTIRPIDVIGLFTGQVGYAWDNVLLYVKGGGPSPTTNTAASFPVDASLLRPTRPNPLGWHGGTGLEVSFAPNWSVGVEYDHLFMGNRNITFPASVFRSIAPKHRSGHRYGNGPRELSLGWSGDREVLIFRANLSLRIKGRPRAGLLLWRDFRAVPAAAIDPTNR